MKNIPLLYPVMVALGLLSCNPETRETDPSQTLWYDSPAETWTEALPVGNGRLGAMVYGGTVKELIQFNEETLWTGQPHDYANPGAHGYLDTLRRLLWEGKQDEAHRLGNDRFMSSPLRQLNYSAFGEIELNFAGRDGETGNYRRQLNLENAISSVSYEQGGVRYLREVFASAPARALIIRMEASEKGAISFSAGMSSPHEDYSVRVEDNVLILTGKANNYEESQGRHAAVGYPDSKLTFEARLRIMHQGGELIRGERSLGLSGASSVTLHLVAATSFVNYRDISADPAERCLQDLSLTAGKKYARLKAEHAQDYAGLYGRVSLDLGNSELSLRPTDERLASFYQDTDPSLVTLLYQYGRYLLISSSRPGTQPANLQGIWNHQLSPAWDSKYTININTEMNYWPAEITNLAELADPLIRLVEDLSETGKNVAREHYGLDGWVAHHNTDIWRGAAPINNANHGVWPTGGAWLCQHLWWHYVFSGDREYLAERAYPVMKEASRFFADYLVAYPPKADWLVSGPSNSPELGGMVMGPTMDHQIIRNLFANTIEAAMILDRDESFAKDLQHIRARIAPNQIGQYGQLQEWLEDQDDPENQHRHVSHLWGLHPGNEIHPLTTPELAEACRVTLSHRGDGGTGWSRAWKINFWARLLDGDHSFLLLKNLMVPAGSKGVSYGGHAGGLYNNLFDAHPPFQIDGNFGATSGITEMLLQSHLRDGNGDYFQDILPALPSALPSGSVAGLRGRGGFEISMDWENMEPVRLEVISKSGNTLKLRYADKVIRTDTSPGEKLVFTTADFR